MQSHREKFGTFISHKLWLWKSTLPIKLTITVEAGNTLISCGLSRKLHLVNIRVSAWASRRDFEIAEGGISIGKKQ